VPEQGLGFAALTGAEEIDGIDRYASVVSHHGCGAIPSGRNHRFCPDAASAAPKTVGRDRAPTVFWGSREPGAPGKSFGTRRPALILMGDWCVPDTAPNHGKPGRVPRAIGGFSDGHAAVNEKKTANGEFLRLDRDGLMGDPRSSAYRLERGIKGCPAFRASGFSKSTERIATLAAMNRPII
jgi:hypothetical protein